MDRWEQSIEYPLTQQGVIDRTKRSLGYPVRSLELTDEQIADAISDAIYLFNRYKPRLYYGTLENVADRTVIQIDNDIDDIIEVQFVREGVGIYNYDMNIFTLDKMLSWRRLGAGDYYEWQHWVEMAKRSFSADPDWFYDQENRRLYIYITGGPYHVMFTGIKNHTLATIPKRLVPEFLMAVEAYCRLRIAEIRSRTPLILPTGNVDVGPRDEDKAKEMLDNLIAKLSEPVPPLMG